MAAKIYLFVLIFLCAATTFGFILTFVPPVIDEKKEQERQNRILVEAQFHFLAVELVSSEKPFIPDYVLLDIASPVNPSKTITLPFLFDTGSTYYVINEKSFEELQLVVIGSCTIIGFRCVDIFVAPIQEIFSIIGPMTN
jgi:hypothetical protein